MVKTSRGSLQGACLAIRADASPTLGIGHAMRCLSLAQAWQAAEGKAVLLSREPTVWLRELYEKDGIEVLPLHHEGGSLADAAESSAYAAELGAAWAVLDLPSSDRAYLAGLRHNAQIRVLAMDNGVPFDSPPDAILNYHLDATTEDLLCSGASLLLAGSRFVLLRKEYWAVAPRDRSIVKRLLLTVGGSDHSNYTGTILLELQSQLPEFEIHVVAGPCFDASSLQPVENRVVIHRHPNSLRTLIESCDIAVCAGGGTTYECLRSGLPMAVFPFTEDQARNCRFLIDNGFAAGIARVREMSVKALVSSAAELARNLNLRTAICEAGRNLIDGKGPSRVVAALQAVSEAKTQESL